MPADPGAFLGLGLRALESLAHLQCHDFAKPIGLVFQDICGFKHGFGPPLERPVPQNFMRRERAFDSVIDLRVAVSLKSLYNFTCRWILGLDSHALPHLIESR